MTKSEYKKELKQLLKDPRSEPDSSWHEQWLIDVEDLDAEYEDALDQAEAQRIDDASWRP